MMKRMMQAGLLVAAIAMTVQAQITAAGSNFTGPGGGGSGTSGTIGAYIPQAGGPVAPVNTASGMPGVGVAGSMQNATGPANVTISGVTISVDAASQQAAASAITSNNPAAFIASLGTAVPGPAAQALGQAMGRLGTSARAFTSDATMPAFISALTSAVDAFNAAINAMPVGTPVPASLIAARAIIAGYYLNAR